MPRLGAAAATALALALAGTVPAQAADGPGVPSPVVATPGAPGGGTPDLTTGLRVPMPQQDPTAAAVAFLAARRGAYRVARPGSDLRPTGTSRAGHVTAVRFAQQYAGVPVLGGAYVVRTRRAGDHTVVTGTSGDYFDDLDVDLAARVAGATAARVTRHAERRTVRGLGLRDHGPVVLPFGSGLLARHLTVTGTSTTTGLPVRRETYVAAGVSRPVLSYDSIDFDGPVATTGPGFHGPALPLQAYQQAARVVLRDTTRGHGIETYDAAGADFERFSNGGIVPGPKLVGAGSVPFAAAANRYGALDAHWGAARVYDFYKSLGRDGLDGSGGRIVSVVGVSSGGHAFPNAFWNGDEMVYGNGGDGYHPFAASLDVVGHEMTHGVEQHSAGLLYFGQSGALSEGMADYFGNAIENQTLGIDSASPLDGLMGQDLCVHKSPAACATRNLDKVRTTAQLVGDGSDFGGVHDNSTIASGAFWQARRILGVDLANRAMYALLTQYLTPLSNFLDARRDFVAAAQQVGATSGQLDQLRHEFDRRGITPGWEHTVAGLDSRQLYPGMSMGGYVSVAGGHWVVTDAGQLGQRLPSVYTGRVDRTGHRLLSPDSHLVYDLPSTDGHQVAWTATRLGAVATRIQVRHLSGGPTRTVASYRNALIWSTAVDHGTVAWHLMSSRGTDRIVVRTPNGHTHTIRAAHRHYFGDFDLDHHQLAYADFDSGKHGAARLMSYDTRTRHRETLATVHPVGALSAGIYQPTLTRRHAFYVADRGRHGLRTGIVRVDRHGRHPKMLVRDTAAHAPRLAWLAASDTAVTYQSYGSSRIWQLPASGGRSRRVSCSHGAQYDPVAAGKRRVLWLDFSAGRMDLVTRATPAGRC